MNFCCWKIKPSDMKNSNDKSNHPNKDQVTSNPKETINEHHPESELNLDAGSLKEENPTPKGHNIKDTRKSEEELLKENSSEKK